MYTTEETEEIKSKEESDEKKKEKDKCKIDDVLKSVNKCLTKFVESCSMTEVSQVILKETKYLTNSKIGFIGEVKYNKSGDYDFLHCWAISDVAWDKKSREHIKQYDGNGFKFFDHDTEIARAVKYGKCIIRNKPIDKPLYPKGHPHIETLMIIPVFHGLKCIGQITMANSPKYEDNMPERLKPVVEAYGQMLFKYNEIIQKEESAKKKNISIIKNQFMANMSHEIRSPLHGIIGPLALLKNTKLTQRQMDCIDMMNKSSLLLMSIINDVLDLAKLESGKMKLNIAPMSIADAIYASHEVFTLKIDAKKLKYSCYIDSRVPEYILSDTQRIRQILINLLSNAVKFTEKGEINIEVTVDDLYRKKLRLSRSEKKYGSIGDTVCVQFAISDTGIGIKKKDVKKLFKAFSQIDTGTTKQYGGNGLGLMICKKFVELMNGRIWFTSEYGKGSTFYFNIVTHSYHPVKKDIDLTELHGKNVLVVDDNPNNITILIDYLDRLKMDHRECVSGKQALRSYINNKRYKFDVALLDICMPGMDGNELSKKINEIYPKLPMIALSSLGEKINEISNCFTFHLTKPYTEEKLAMALKTTLEYNSESSESSSRSATPTTSIPKLSTILISESSTSDLSEQKKIQSKIITEDKSLKTGRKIKKKRHKKSHRKSSTSKSSRKTGSMRKRKKKKKKKIVKNKSEEITKPHIMTFASLETGSKLAMATNSDLKILIAEDEPTFQVLMIEMLKTLGYKNIDTCLNGQEAVEKVIKNKYDVVLMDIKMPILSGDKATVKIHNMIPDPDKRPKIIALTANALNYQKAYYLNDVNMDGFITKPIADLNILLKELEKIPVK